MVPVPHIKMAGVLSTIYLQGFRDFGTMSQIHPIQHALLHPSMPLVLPVHVLVLAISIVLGALVVFVVVREVFAPPHLQTLLQRKQYRLPPGPAGYPIVGNLLEWRHARRSTPALIQYVIIPNCPHPSYPYN